MSTHQQLVPNFWEGIYTNDFTLEQVRRRCYRLGETLATRSWSCLVAYDTRFMSNLFAHDIASLLGRQGVNVTLAQAPAPLPTIQFALDQQRAHCALVVTARNRPYWCNGLVLLGSSLRDVLLHPYDGALADQEFPSPSLTAQVQPNTADQSPDLRSPYLEMLRSRIDVDLIRRSMLTIFVDPMSGSTAGYVPVLISDGGQTRAIEINRETDPLFNKLTPLPATSGLTRLRKLVRESDSHLGLAFSADGTALGVIDKNGDQPDMLEVVLLLAAYLSHQYRHKGLLIGPLPASGSPLAGTLPGLRSWENTTGIRVELSNNASARIAELQGQERSNLLLGCTAGGELVLGRYGFHPDALLAGLFLIELIARNSGNLRSLIEEQREWLKAE
ncbi:MAG: phosphoglucomutase [Chloroflexales bacterium]|nr:phosphoglucomutase [Chloroflexales bacterium]